MSAIEVNSAGHFVVVGAINFVTAIQIYARGRQLIAASPKPVFDLHSVTATDNTGVALLTAWTRYAKRLNKAVLFIDLTQQLLDLVRVGGLCQILPIKQEDN